MSRQMVKEWFDSLEEILNKEAKLAGILDHGTMVGIAREFFVKRILTGILPPVVHVGTGRVIGAENDEKSRQVDIVIYDARCPFLESQPGMGLYFVEGVIATIEIKSTLNAPELRTGLDNCLSVLQIPIHVPTTGDMDRRTKEWMAATGSLQPNAREMVIRELKPKTFIFAFATTMSAECICRHVSLWYDDKRQFQRPENPFLPNVIAVKGTVGLQRESWLNPTAHLLDSTRSEIREKHGPAAEIVMAFFDDSHGLGWLAIHLIQTINEYFGLSRDYGGLKKSISDHLPGSEYFQQQPNTHFHSVVWSGGGGAPSFFSSRLPPRAMKVNAIESDNE